MGNGNIEPGWYPDPSGQGGERWWDGARWTDRTRDLDAAAAPAGRRSGGVRTLLLGAGLGALVVGAAVVGVLALGTSDDDVQTISDEPEADQGPEAADEPSAEPEPRPEEQAPEPPEETPEPDPLTAPPTGLDPEERDAFAGSTVNLMSLWTGEDESAFLEAISVWSGHTGAEVWHEGSADLPTLLPTRVEGGNPPDVVVAHLGPLEEVHRSYAALRALEPVLDTETVRASLVDGLDTAGEVDGSLVAVPYLVTVKSMVWYPRGPFEAGGYAPPSTWDELLELSAEIRSDGVAPWCIGAESGPASGWVLTDWLEDLVLRTAGPQAYDEWVAGELAFHSEPIITAAELFADLAFTDGNVAETRAGIAATSFGDSARSLLDDPPSCLLHRQASFLLSFLADDVAQDPMEDLGWFPLPEIDPRFGTPAVVGADLAALLSDDPAAASLLRYLASPDALSHGWGSAVSSPHRTFDAMSWPSAIQQELQRYLGGASFVRLDASDHMPAAVGEAFWSGMLRWVADTDDLRPTLQGIDDSWP